MEEYQFHQVMRIIHALARIATEVESYEGDQQAVVRALSVIEDAHIKSEEPPSYTLVFSGEDDEISISINISIRAFEEGGLGYT